MIDARILATASPQEFSAEARRLLNHAETLSRQISDAELSQWMVIAKGRRMTWVEGLAFAIEQMEQRTNL